MPMYGKFPINALGGELLAESFALDWLSDTVKCSLHTSTYTPDQDNHELWSDVTNEVSGTGYTARGGTLGTKTISYNSSSNLSTFSAAQQDWASSTITARYAVVYKDTGTNSTSILVAYFDFGSNQSSNNGTFSVVWSGSGIITFTVS